MENSADTLTPSPPPQAVLIWRQREVSISGDYVLAGSVTDAMLWTFAEDGDGFDVTNGGNYLNRRSSNSTEGGGIYVSDTEEGSAGYSDWIYASIQIHRSVTHTARPEQETIYLYIDSSLRHLLFLSCLLYQRHQLHHLSVQAGRGYGNKQRVGLGYHSACCRRNARHGRNGG